MRGDQLTALLDTLRGVRVWVAGGWAVDAIVGEQTRPHADLDLAVDASDLNALLNAVGQDGFVVTTDWSPARLELTAPDGRVIDVHPVAFAADGSGVQVGLGGEEFRYAADGFTIGIVDGRPVPCLSVAQQLLFRRGYPLRDVDLHDLALLDTERIAPRVNPRRGDDRSS